MKTRFPAGFVMAIVQATGVTRGRVYQVLNHAPVTVRAVSIALGAIESLKGEGLTPLEAIDRLLESGDAGHQAWFTYSLAGRRRSVARWQVSWLGVLMLYSVYYDTKVLEDTRRAPVDSSGEAGSRPG